MATEILHPQDILNRGAFPRRKPIHSRKPKPARSSFDDVVAEIPRSGEVMILRRGQSLDGRMKGKISGMRNRIDIYAGSAFLSTSPPPSSLPLPSFPAKKVVVAGDDSATRDLRRLLRLE